MQVPQNGVDQSLAMEDFGAELAESSKLLMIVC
jgi:hypothetical protein